MCFQEKTSKSSTLVDNPNDFSLSLTFLQYIYNSMAIVEMIYGPMGIRYFGVNLGDTIIIRSLMVE